MPDRQQPQRQRDLIVLGRAIRRVREQQDVTAAELAAASGVERPRIDALEAGRVDPSYELLLALARGLRIRPSVFVICAEDIRARGHVEDPPGGPTPGEHPPEESPGEPPPGEPPPGEPG